MYCCYRFNEIVCGVVRAGFGDVLCDWRWRTTNAGEKVHRRNRIQKHIGLYPKASAIAAFKTELAAYKTSKGAIQFPLEKPIPVRLVKSIVKFRLKENAAKS